MRDLRCRIPPSMLAFGSNGFRDVVLAHRGRHQLHQAHRPPGRSRPRPDSSDSTWMSALTSIGLTPCASDSDAMISPYGVPSRSESIAGGSVGLGRRRRFDRGWFGVGNLVSLDLLDQVSCACDLAAAPKGQDDRVPVDAVILHGQRAPGAQEHDLGGGRRCRNEQGNRGRGEETGALTFMSRRSYHRRAHLSRIATVELSGRRIGPWR